MEIQDNNPSNRDEKQTKKQKVQRMGNDNMRAKAFVDAYQTIIRYVPGQASWYVWDDVRWTKDTTGHMLRLCREFSETYIKNIKDNQKTKHGDTKTVKEPSENGAVLQTGDLPVMKRMLEVAQVDSRIIVLDDELDANPMIVGVRNGVIDLKTGEFRKGRPEDLVTKSLGVTWDGNAQCPRFNQFLEEIFPNQPDMTAFMARAFGYTLTGDISEQVFFFLHGMGANGKSCLVKTLFELMGDYAGVIDPEIITQKRGASTPGHLLAELRGLRFANLAETEDASRLAESRIKSITSGDPITACRKYEHPITFRPKAKLWIHGNHQLDIKGADDGIWRRVLQVPFDVSIPTERRDPNLEETLRSELPGILNFAIQGCLDWGKQKLTPPAVVLAVTEEYRKDQDIIGEFLETHLEANPSGRIVKFDLFHEYRSWAINHGFIVDSSAAFGKKLKSRGIKDSKSGNDRFWLGYSIRHPARITTEALNSDGLTQDEIEVFLHKK